MVVGYFIGVNRDFKLIEIPVLFENEIFSTKEFFEDVLLFDLFINQQRYFYRGFNAAETHAFNNTLSVELIQERYFRSEGQKLEFNMEYIFRLSCCDFTSRIPSRSELALPDYDPLFTFNVVNGPNSNYPLHNFAYGLYSTGGQFIPTIIEDFKADTNTVVWQYRLSDVVGKEIAFIAFDPNGSNVFTLEVDGVQYAQEGYIYVFGSQSADVVKTVIINQTLQ
ncbi:structural protein [Cellulophaga phage phi12a:1]|uniref:Structural protein n=1 Tax=Cellulophaga phage phi12a:1 TaxID=1327987 RepID=S0A245_9VIRU|nr:structural protein [Cellulophaga phage phi12a:1]AGO48875.1 structural protein [Cellulophaga phage phi12a:1]